VPGKNPRTNKGDNAFISDVADGKEDCETEDDYDENGLPLDVRCSGNVVPRDRSYWGEW